MHCARSRFPRQSTGDTVVSERCEKVGGTPPFFLFQTTIPVRPLVRTATGQVEIPIHLHLGAGTRNDNQHGRRFGLTIHHGIARLRSRDMVDIFYRVSGPKLGEAKRVLLCPTEGQILQLSSSWPVEAEMLLGYLAITVISFKTCQFSRHFFSIFPSTYAHQKFDSHFQESLRLKLLFIDIIFISVTNFEGGRSEKKKKRPIRYALYLGRLFRQILLSYMNLCRSQLCAQS